MIGIYKITSPTKKVYIGQSINIENRFKSYKSLDCKKQPAIYRSLLKYGFNKHKFEILCECNIEELNELERYYQDVFSVTGKNGLNCVLTKTNDRRREYTEETKAKMSKWQLANKVNLGKKQSEETRKKIRDFQYNLPEHMKIARELKKIKTQEKRKNKQKKMQADYVHSLKRIVLNTQTGVFYYSVVEAAESINMNKHTLGCELRGHNKSKTPFIYV